MDFFQNNWFLIFLFFVALTLMSFMFVYHKKELKLNTWQSILTAVGMFTIGASCAFLFGKFLDNGGISIFGFMLSMPLVNIAYCKIRKLPIETCDLLWTIDLIGYFSCRWNCFYNGCCHGILLSNGHEFPAREIENSVLISLIIVFLVLKPKNKLKNFAQPILLISYGVVRFIVQFFKVEYKFFNFGFATVNTCHFWAIIMTLLGIVLLIINIIRLKKEKNNFSLLNLE
jgi:prolipoprotein diacylglyceryltransferase